MVQIDIPMAFGLGSFFAGAARDKIAAGDATACWRALAKSLVFQCLFVFWLPLYLLVNYFGFQTTHMWWHGDSLADYPWLLPARPTAPPRRFPTMRSRRRSTWGRM